MSMFDFQFSFGGQSPQSPGTQQSLQPKNSSWPEPLASSGTGLPSSAEVEAERLWWAEASERQVEDLSKAVKLESDKLQSSIDAMKAVLKEELREEMAGLTEEFAAQLSSLEQRLRREQQANHEAALEATVQVRAPLAGSPVEIEALRVLLATEPRQRLQELTTIVEELAMRSNSAEKRIQEAPKRAHIEASSGLDVEDRLADLADKHEKRLAHALADERAARGKALAELWKYTEHITSLLESDARNASHRSKMEIADLSARLKALEEQQADQIWQLEHSQACSPLELDREAVKRASISTAATDSNRNAGTLQALYSATSSERPSSQPVWANTSETELPGQFAKYQRLISASSSKASSRLAHPLALMENKSTSSLTSVRPTSECESGAGSMTLPVFSEEMKESLKHIVQKVSDTMGTVSPRAETRSHPISARVPSSAPLANRNLR